MPSNWGYPDKIRVNIGMTRWDIFEALQKHSNRVLRATDEDVIKAVEDIDTRMRNWLGHQAFDFVERKAAQLAPTLYKEDKNA